MPRKPRTAARKAIKYTDVPPSSDEDEGDTELTDAGESASVASSRRKGSAQKDEEDEDSAWDQGASSLAPN